MGKTDVSASGAGNDTLLMDFGIFNQRRTSMLSAVEKLKFDMRPAEMENKVCGTETMMELMSMWEKVAKTSDNFREFYTGCVDKSLVETADSIYAANEQVANSLNRFGNTNNSFNGAKGTPYTYVDLLANQKPGAVFGIKGIDMQQSGKMDPGFLAALHGANLQSGTAHLTKVDYLRKDFMNRYNVDSATMARVEQMIAECQSGDTTCLDKLNRYQNLSSADWKNLSDAEYQDFTDLAVLSAYSGYMLEHGKGEVSDLDTYKTISEKAVSKMYTIDELGRAQVDVSLASAMKGAYNSLGASDTLAYNILTKIEEDKTAYYTCAPMQSMPEDVNVYMDYDENGFVTVRIQDSYITDSVQTTQFLATGKDHATEYFETIRSNASDCSNHGLTEDQLIGMIQTVENPNDLQIMNNIATSDREFNANGKSAFDIDYWEDTPESGIYYSRGVSNGFSVSLGQMGANMLQTGNEYDYRMYSRAAIEASVNGNNHNILVDISSGAGLYVDACSLTVIGDEVGGGNDQELKETLNAANANYGAFAQMCGAFDDHPAIGHHVKFTNIDVQDIDYDAETGYIYFNVKCDKKTTGALVINTNEKGVDIGIKSDLEYGKLATNSKMTNAEETLKKELDKKRNEIVVDCLIDLAGEVNPYLKQGLTITKDLATGDEAYSDSADLVKDGIKDTLHSDGFDTGASCTLTVIGAFKKYDDAVKAYEKAKKDCEDNKKLQTFYSYNTGSHTVGLYDYECIRKVQNWNKNGISEVVGASGKSNDDIYNSLTNEDGYRKDVVRIIGEELCNDEHEFDYLEKGADGHIEDAYIEIKKSTGYSQENIDNAMRIAIYGYSKDGEYHTVTDVPCDLMNACLKAISDKDGADVNVYRYWEDFTDEIG